MLDEALPTPGGLLPVRSFQVKVAVGVLLATYAILAFAASLYKGPAFDEPKTLAIGYNIWRGQDFRMEGAHGDFLKRWATLPFLLTKPNALAENDPAVRDALPFQLGYEFFSLADNSPELLLMQGRAMVVLLGVALGLLIFVCAREIAGVVGGLSALIIFVFSPNMLAYGAMVTMEVPLCLALLGATWCIWHLLHRVTPWRLAGSLIFFAMLALSKPSALVIFPVALVMWLVKFFSRRPLAWEIGRPRTITARTRQTGIFVGLGLLHLLVAGGAIWADYDFRYAATPNTAAELALAKPATGAHDAADAAVEKFIDVSRGLHLLPEGFLNGAQVLLQETDERATFLDGQWNADGWPTFFLNVMWEKTSPTIMVIFLIGLGCWAWSLAKRVRARLWPADGPATPGPIDIYESAPYIALMLAFFAVMASDSLNYGHRSILPVSPALYILGGCGAAVVWNHRTRWFRTLVIVLLLTRVGQAFSIYPDFLAYFNPLVDSPDQGYQHLVDRSLDWGMDLPRLKTYLDKHNPGEKLPVYLAYFGTDDPGHYGIVCQRLPGYPDWTARGQYPFQPGIYVISATLFQTLYTSTFGPWNKVFEDEYLSSITKLQKLQDSVKNPAEHAAMLAAHPPGYWEHVYSVYEKLRFARLCAWLRHHETPDTSAGYSLLIWNLDATELRAALYSAPVELADKPL